MTRHDDDHPQSDATPEPHRSVDPDSDTRDGTTVTGVPQPAAHSVLRAAGGSGGLGGVKLDALDDEPQVPELVQGSAKYSVHETLGEGGMGKVYLARDQDLRRPVALKMSKSKDAAHLSRFVAEAQVMGQLQHPSIVPVHELGQAEGGRLYYAMPVVRGRTLADVVKGLREGDAAKRKDWSLTRLVQAFLQACGAVSYAHEKGVIHRDIKPENVMVGRHGEVQVLDWGLSRVVGEGAVELHDGVRSDSGLVAGTPAYMAPEQARGERADARTDVYGLGALLYELLTLRPPFRGAPEQVIAAVVRDEVVPPRQRAPGRSIPQVLDRVVVRALSKRREDRPQTVDGLSSEVQEWVEAEADRTRRRELADQKAAEGHALLEEYRRLKDEVVRLEEEANARAREVESWQPLEEKRAMHEAEDAASRAESALVDAASRLVATFTEALGFDPEHRPSRTSLSEYYWDRLEQAEERAVTKDVEFFTRLVSSYHDGKYARELSGEGSLELRSEPEGAEVWLHEYVEEDLVRQPRNARLLGKTPLEPTLLGMGSYLVVLKKEGYRDTRYPVFISRNREWRGEVRLYTDEEIGEGYVHVPAGSFIQGGDPECLGWDLPRSEPWLEDVYVSEHPVTNAEYLEYLDEVVEAEGLEVARARSPRRSSDPATSYLEEREGLLVLPEEDAEGDAWRPAYPVIGISWHDAVAYCEWRSEREGQEVRLPTESEWEKAARGVDGRWFPWGDRFDASLCNMRESRREGPDLVAVEEYRGEHPWDVSVYGVRGMGGNVRDWTSTEGEGPRAVRVVRGGAWRDNSIVTRSAGRSLYGPSLVYDGLGFRPVRFVRAAVARRPPG